MKTRLHRNASPSDRRQYGQQGTAVIVMLALLSILLLCLAANTRTLNSLRQELKLTEQRQIRRLNLATATNSATAWDGSLMTLTPGGASARASRRSP